MKWVLFYYCNLGIKIFNIQVQINDPFQSFRQNGLIVSNHLSYLDIIVIGTYMPACFVTSVEVKNTLFLGQIVEFAGCLFVERRSKSNIGNEISDISRAIASGLDVLVFPEATSTNGEKVLNFKRPLFNSALEITSIIKPITINYKTLDGVTLSLTNRDKICWYGDMSFFPHFWDFLKTKETIVSITCGEPFFPKLNDDKSTLAFKAHDIVSNQYRKLA